MELLLKESDEARIFRLQAGEVQESPPPAEVQRNAAKAALLDKLGVRSTLTARETQVMQLVTEGCSARTMAAKLFLSTRTAEHHVERIKEKLGCFSREELVQKAKEFAHFDMFS